MSKLHVDALYEQLIRKFVTWAQEREDIKAAVIVGSRARADYPADEWADLDLLGNHFQSSVLCVQKRLDREYGYSFTDVYRIHEFWRGSGTPRTLHGND